MKLQQSAENYLENIYILKQRMGNVRSVDLANEMGFSKPSVSRAIHLLEENGYIQIEDNGFLNLTDKGEQVALKIYERHVFLTRYFMALGVPEEIAAEDACRIEHDISDISFDRMKSHIHHCANDCPHAPVEHFFQFNKVKINSLEPEQNTTR